MIRNESIDDPAMLLKKLYSIAPLLVGEKYEKCCVDYQTFALRNYAALERAPELENCYNVRRYSIL